MTLLERNDFGCLRCCAILSRLHGNSRFFTSSTLSHNKLDDLFDVLVVQTSICNSSPKTIYLRLAQRLVVMVCLSMHLRKLAKICQPRFCQPRSFSPGDHGRSGPRICKTHEMLWNLQHLRYICFSKFAAKLCEICECLRHLATFATHCKIMRFFFSKFANSRPLCMCVTVSM